MSVSRRRLRMLASREYGICLPALAPCQRTARYSAHSCTRRASLSSFTSAPSPFLSSLTSLFLVRETVRSKKQCLPEACSPSFWVQRSHPLPVHRWDFYNHQIGWQGLKGKSAVLCASSFTEEPRWPMLSFHLPPIWRPTTFWKEADTKFVQLAVAWSHVCTYWKRRDVPKCLMLMASRLKLKHCLTVLSFRIWTSNDSFVSHT